MKSFLTESILVAIASFSSNEIAEMSKLSQNGCVLNFELAASIAPTKGSAAINTVIAAYVHIDKVQNTSVKVL